jgi:hypothetical protein
VDNDKIFIALIKDNCYKIKILILMDIPEHCSAIAFKPREKQSCMIRAYKKDCGYYLDRQHTKKKHASRTADQG